MVIFIFHLHMCTHNMSSWPHGIPNAGEPLEGEPMETSNDKTQIQPTQKSGHKKWLSEYLLPCSTVHQCNCLGDSNCPMNHFCPLGALDCKMNENRIQRFLTKSIAEIHMHLGSIWQLGRSLHMQEVDRPNLSNVLKTFRRTSKVLKGKTWKKTNQTICPLWFNDARISCFAHPKHQTPINGDHEVLLRRLRRLMTLGWCGGKRVNPWRNGGNRRKPLPQGSQRTYYDKLYQPALVPPGSTKDLHLYNSRQWHWCFQTKDVSPSKNTMYLLREEKLL